MMSNDTIGELARNAEYREASIKPVVDKLTEIHGELCLTNKLLNDLLNRMYYAQPRIWPISGLDE